MNTYVPLHVEPTVENREGEKQVVSEMTSTKESEEESDDEQVFEAYITEDMIKHREHQPSMDFESEKVHTPLPSN